MPYPNLSEIQHQLLARSLTLFFIAWLLGHNLSLWHANIVSDQIEINFLSTSWLVICKRWGKPNFYTLEFLRFLQIGMLLDFRGTALNFFSHLLIGELVLSVEFISHNYLIILHLMWFRLTSFHTLFYSLHTFASNIFPQFLSHFVISYSRLKFSTIPGLTR